MLVGLLRGFYGRHGGAGAFAALSSAKALGGAFGCGVGALVAEPAVAATALALGAAYAMHTARRPRPRLDLLPGRSTGFPTTGPRPDHERT